MTAGETDCPTGEINNRSVTVRVLYVMYNSMRFEWDAEKNRSNQKKHAGIDFETHRAYLPIQV